MKVSIIIPFWNVADYVDRCMRSVTAQTHSDLEIIAVDNASTDGTGEKLKKWADANGRIKIITMDENVGPGPARNAGLDTATGEYICFVDGDDCISPFYVEKLLAWATDNDCKIALCGYSLNDSKTPPESCAVSLELNGRKSSAQGIILSAFTPTRKFCMWWCGTKYITARYLRACALRICSTRTTK